MSALEWSQAVWKVAGRTVDLDICEHEFLHDILVQHLPKEALLLDAGCGTGRWPIYLRRHGYRAIGVEIDHEAAVVAREHDAGLALAQADVWRLPFKSHSLDVVLSLGVVEHNEDGPLDALRETQRVLKRGGLLFLAVPFNNPFRRLVVNHLQTYVNRQRRKIHPEFRFGEYRFTQREVRSFLQRTGFEVIAAYPNDTRPPWTVGLWVDYSNLIFSPLAPQSGTPFILPGWKGKAARRALRMFPWLVCAEIAVVARAR